MPLIATVVTDTYVAANGEYPSFCSGRTSNIEHKFITSFLYHYCTAVADGRNANAHPQKAASLCATVYDHSNNLNDFTKSSKYPVILDFSFIFPQANYHVQTS